MKISNKEMARELQQIADGKDNWSMTHVAAAARYFKQLADKEKSLKVKKKEVK